jgi:hypothetical protein
MPEVFGHFLVQRGLEDRFGELLLQPVGPGQGQALLGRHPDQLLGCQSSAEGSGLFLFTASSVVITAPSPPGSRPAGKAGNTEFETVPTP